MEDEDLFETESNSSDKNTSNQSNSSDKKDESKCFIKVI